MIEASIYDHRGAVVAVGMYPDSDTLTLNVPDGGGYMVGQVNPEAVYFAAGEVVARPDRPSPCHSWDWSTLSWIEDESELDRVWANLRAERSRRLAACDWTQVADAPLTDEQKSAWASYRQALRDLPEMITDLTEIVWPEQP